MRPQKEQHSNPLSLILCLFQLQPPYPTPSKHYRPLPHQKKKTLWKRCSATQKEAVWQGPDNKPCLPKHFFPHFAKLTHGLDHVSKGGMLDAITRHWFTKGFSAYAQKFCQYATHNTGKTKTITHAAHPPPNRPFEHLMMDFIELSPAEGKKYCLVMVDMVVVVKMG